MVDGVWLTTYGLRHGAVGRMNLFVFESIYQVSYSWSANERFFKVIVGLYLWIGPELTFIGAKAQSLMTSCLAEVSTQMFYGTLW